MKNLFYILALLLVSCRGEQKDITGHWTVDKQFSNGTEITPVNTGITFTKDGILELEWAQEPNMTLPQTTYRVSNDTIYWTSEVVKANTAAQEGKLVLEWNGDNLILRADETNYTVLKRDQKQN